MSQHADLREPILEHANLARTSPMSGAAFDGATPERPRRCGRCGATYEAERFADLTPVRRLASADLVEHVVHWPESVVVDVRECARCEAPIARLARQRL
jgi:ribosomal protein S27AE